jgi:hypothetical protein
MAVKVINNLAGLDGIMPILLVFEAYLRMIKDSIPLSFVIDGSTGVITVS